MLSQINQLIFFHLGVTSVNEWIVDGTRQNTLAWLVLVSTNNMRKYSSHVFSRRTSWLSQYWCTLFKWEEIPNIKLIWFSWPITSVIYWIIPAMTRNMLLWLIDAGVNKCYQWPSVKFQQNDHTPKKILKTIAWFWMLKAIQVEYCKIKQI